MLLIGKRPLARLFYVEIVNIGPVPIVAPFPIQALAATNLYLAKQGLLTDKMFVVSLRWDRAPRGYVNRAPWKHD